MADNNKTNLISKPNLKKQSFRTAKGLEINKKDFKIDEKFINSKYKKLSFFVRTYGCQANVVDSQVIDNILIKMGFNKSLDIENADLIILNTCAIRENAELKVFGEIGWLVKKRKNNPNIRVGVCGCMVQQENVFDRLSKNQHVDFIFGTHNIDQLPEIIYESYINNNKILSVKHQAENKYKILPRTIEQKHKAFVTIMDGCDKFCTYCIVPYTRGQQISRSKEDIIDEIKHLMQNGLKEVTLIGQNVNSYGLDFKDKTYHFKDLLEDIAKLNIPRIRFSTSNPWNLNKDLIDVMAKYDNIMPYIHLPIQSGDEEILKQMNRKMLIKDYIDLVDYLREKIPDISISTDLIVGFPNESSEAFRHTIDLYNRIKYDNAYTFIYSKREGTPAAKIIDHVTLTEKKKRLYELDELVRKYAKEANEKFVGKVLDVLVDGVSKNNAKRLTGYSPQWKVVNFTGDAKIGDIVKVKINEASRFSLSGKQVKN
ncbi:MAG: tRNA (N6-isopentenyl adenosine(37)-C2)-methylthiotransferase MiaB [Mycoplasmataceae bacterium]|nr:tRNA (N6-isopentenyl adenosine(37)-C2)-methylthiotransferase MiaB [Mycoplasmataceae bacterium]